MNRNKSLEHYYSGDEDWHKMVEMAKNDFWIKSEYQLELLKSVNSQEDIAMVIFAKKRNNSLKWILNESNPLDGLKPVDCLNDPTLILRLREALMRMPMI